MLKFYYALSINAITSPYFVYLSVWHLIKFNPNLCNVTMKQFQHFSELTNHQKMVILLDPNDDPNRIMLTYRYSDCHSHNNTEFRY